MAYRVRVENRVLTTIVVQTIKELDISVRNLLSTIRNNKNTDLKPILGIDIEKHFISNGTPKVIQRVAVIKLCFGTNCLIIQLLHMGRESPCSLAEFMQLQDVSFVGVGMNHILQALSTDYGITIRNAIDLGLLAATVREAEIYKSYNLLNLANSVFLSHVHNNSGQEAFGYWGAENLSPTQVDAATWDAFMCFYVVINCLVGIYLNLNLMTLTIVILIKPMFKNETISPTATLVRYCLSKRRP